ncbi:MAG: response regulator [Gemmatimonadetes bacterium]|nr:response regulator [Gemmatimonadota bacterium]
MSQDLLRQEINELRERISKLSAASLRISASLDLDTVLQEVVDRARELTGARYGAIITIDETGLSQDFVTSGLTDEEHRIMADWPEGERLFEHFRDLRGSLQLPDVPAYLRSLGFSTDLLPPGAVHGQGTSMRYRGLHVGNFFLADKESGEAFTNEDEEVLVLFASQAATTIANARAHRAEQRARADLEALIETSPIGVVVFDAGTGHPTWFNRETRRIVESLRTPGRPIEDLLELLILQRADGSEIALGQAPMSQILSHTETVRAEEIVLSVPDGRSVTTLVNSTPIRSEDGAVVSVVVTMQDMKPLQELDRMRTEFVGMVSHELRAPLTSIKGSATTLLEASQSLDPAEMREFYRIILTQADHMRVLISDLLDAGRIDAGTLSVAPEPSEAAALVDGGRNTFRSGGGRHEVLIDLPPDLPLVMADRQRIEQVLNNLLANAALHAPESSPIRVRAERDGTHVAISVRDEGRGVAPDRLPHMFRKYASFDGNDRESAIAGSGLGLAICKGLVEANGGRIWAESPGIGRGTRVTFTVPLAESREPAPRKPPEPGPVPADTLNDGEGREPIRILVLDDDPQMLRYVRDMLVAGGYDAVVTGDHASLPRIIKTERPDLVLLDLLLTDTDGIQLMENVPDLAELPVIFISANGRDETIAKALDTGAADYIVKPFSATELLARIRTALRKRAETEPFVLGDLTIDYDQRRVSVADVPVVLTPIEYDLLRALSLNAGRVTTFDVLIRQIWSTKSYANPKLVRAFVKKLRRKLGDDAGKPRYIINERGVGYRMGRPGVP